MAPHARDVPEMEHLVGADQAAAAGWAGGRRLGVAAVAVAVLGAVALLFGGSCLPADAGLWGAVGLSATPKITPDLLKKDLAGLHHKTTKNEESSHPPVSEDAVAAVLKVCEDANGDSKKICKEFGAGSCDDCAKKLAAAWSNATTAADRSKVGTGLLRGEFKCDALAAGADAAERKLDDDDDYWGATAVVIDMGDGLTQVGFAGQDGPEVEFPTIVGRPRHPGMVGGIHGLKSEYVGGEAQSKRGILNMERPVQSGKVMNWEDWERVLRYSFDKELRVAPEKFPLVLVEAPQTSPEDREKMAKVVFDQLHMPKLYIASSAVLAVMAAGETTGIAVVGGADSTYIAPVVDCAVVERAVQKLEIGSNTITEYLMQLLSETGYVLTTTAERMIVNDIRKKLAYVPLDFDQEVSVSEHSSSVQKHYEFPDGQVITVGAERFKCVEALFKPSLVGLDAPALPALIHAAVAAWDDGGHGDSNVRRRLISNIVLAGENSLYPGLGDRLFRDISSPAFRPVRILDVANRDKLPWIGGSLLGSESIFDWLLVTKGDFQAKGLAAMKPISRWVP